MGAEMSYEGRISKQSQQRPSGWAPDSGKPPCGWCIAILLGVAVFALILYGPTMAARIIGM